jgi:hypothetical protein
MLAKKLTLVDIKLVLFCGSGRAFWCVFGIKVVIVEKITVYTVDERNLHKVKVNLTIQRLVSAHVQNHQPSAY